MMEGMKPAWHYGRKWKKTQTKLPSNNSLSHERGSERSERASKRVSGASERANGQASGPVLQSVLLAVLDHSGLGTKTLLPK